MFVLRFADPREGRLIQRIKIDGPFITFYVDKQDVEKGIEWLQKIDSEKYSVLSMGQGVMHDYAHGKTNKHLNFLFGSRKGHFDHFHIACPGMANADNLTELLSCFSSNDLNEVEKYNILNAYQNYLTRPSLDRQIMVCEGYSRVMAAIGDGDHIISKRMPMFLQVFKKLNAVLSKINPQIDDNQTINVDNYQINVKQCTDNILLCMHQIGNIQEISKLLTQYKKNDLAKDQLVEQLQEKFNAATKMPFINIHDVLPFTEEECKNNFHFTNLIKLYENTANELSILLDYKLHFVPQKTIQTNAYSAVENDTQNNEKRCVMF